MWSYASILNLNLKDSYTANGGYILLLFYMIYLCFQGAFEAAHTNDV